MRMISEHVVFTLAVLVIVAVAAGCNANVNRAQVATQTSLTSAAEALDATSDILAGLRVETASAEIIEARVRAEGLDGDAAMARYDEIVEGWERAGVALTSSQQAALALQAALDIWISTGNLPDDWPRLCSSAGNLVDQVVAGLRAVGVDAPEELDSAGLLVRGACTIVVDLVAQEGES